MLDLLVLWRDGAITRLSREATDRTWDADGDRARRCAASGLEPGAARLVLADLDNNGAADLIVARHRRRACCSGRPSGTFTPLRDAASRSACRPWPISTATAGSSSSASVKAGSRSRVEAEGAKSYHWQVLRPRAATATGDQRINSFGIGGEIELRSGLHAQKQLITSPLVHFGLGEATRAEVVRITWPNGALQSEFDTKADQTVKATQRLKGSCPWLFAWNGREMAFVTDLIWRSPLGLRINAQATADVLMTEDWVKVRGDQLAPRDGAYDLRITAELWETHFFDLVSLLAVDHPDGTEVFVDERFAVPAPKLQVVPTGPVQPFASVRDDRGGDVSDLAARARLAPRRLRRPRPLSGHHAPALRGDGAAGRGAAARPSLARRPGLGPSDRQLDQRRDRAGRACRGPRACRCTWRTRAAAFVRCARASASRRARTRRSSSISRAFSARPGRAALRLATNLEIFWDRLGWAVGRPDVSIAPRRLELLTRGSRLSRLLGDRAGRSPASRSARATSLAGTASRWRDLEGYYTRFGDVRELLTDRGRPLRHHECRRRAPPALPGSAAARGGLVRDFVVVGDGWVKDGDYNTSFSRTVLPLPTHRQRPIRHAAGASSKTIPSTASTQRLRRVPHALRDPDAVRDALRVPA